MSIVIFKKYEGIALAIPWPGSEMPLKIATAGLRAANCQRQLAAPELPWQFRELVLKLPLAQGIGAESPQKLQWLVAILLSQNRCSPMHPGQFRGLGADSPVFLPAHGGQKKAPIYLAQYLFPLYTFAMSSADDGVFRSGNL
ncbi:MAG: hypothetical protein LBK13_07960, partial [Spirochaetales bacterium]|nr:hypothetical protein [Spirochaetales bacterium]